MAGYIGSKASVVSSGAERKKVFAITTTTTSLTGLNYTPNLVHVFHNGIRLVDGTDYTATNGTTITLTNAAQNGDEVVVVSYATFQTSDTVSASAGGTFSGDVNFTGAFTSNGIDDNASSTAMTIDSSGNVLVGKTSADFGATAGMAMQSNDTLYVARDGGGALALNRLSSGGDIIDFRFNGTTRGMAGISGNYPYFGGTDTGLRYDNGSNGIFPFNCGELSYRDNTIDLGFSGARFKDLYLSGGVYLGGTGAANLLNDYEEGTWTPVLTNSGGNWTGSSGSYTKVGNTVTIHFAFDSGGGDAGFYTGGVTSLTSASLPFTPNTDSYYAIPLYYAVGADATQKGTYGIFLRPSGDNPLRYFRDGSSPEQLSGDDLGSLAVIQSTLTYTTNS